MFLQLERRYNPDPADQRAVDTDRFNRSVFNLNANQVIGVLEWAWAHRYLGGDAYSSAEDQDWERLGSASPPALQAILAGYVPWTSGSQAIAGPSAAAPGSVVWDHLIFAYLIECTYAYEIFARVILEYTARLRRDVLEPQAQQWLSTTQTLFYTSPTPVSVLSLTSNLQPDIRAIRAADYAWMLGLPLTHQQFDGRPFPRLGDVQANYDFAPTLEEFLREVWRGIVNARNSSGANDTDDGAIARLARRLYDMLVTARRYGVLDRNEFVHVSTFAWFYLALLRDYPLIRQLKAEGSSPYERLRNVAARIGLTPHSRSEQFFNLADTLPMLLRLIETGVLNTETNARLLYADRRGGGNRLRDVVDRIVVNWSVATGHDIKSQVTVATRIRDELPRAPRPILPARR